MSECGASLAELRNAQNITEKPRARGTRFSKRCDCKHSNGLDPVCRCTKPPPGREDKAVRVVRPPPSVPPPTPRASRRIYTQTKPLVFQSSAPRMGLNLNGDTIPIPSRYKNRQFPAAVDHNLHWMQRPETPPQPAHLTTFLPPQFEETPHHRRGPMMPSKGSLRPNAMAETSLASQPTPQTENKNNFHGPETKGESHKADSSVSPDVPAVNPPQEASSMYKMNRGYDYDKINNIRQAEEHTSHPPAQEHVPKDLPVQETVSMYHPMQEPTPMSHPMQEPKPMSHPMQEPTPMSHPMQETVPTSYHVQQPVPSHAVQEASNRATEPVPASSSVPTPTPTPVAQRVPTHTAELDRPPTPIPSQNNFVQEIEAARIYENVTQPNTNCPPSWAPPEMTHTQMMGQRDLPPCPDHFYPCSHC